MKALALLRRRSMIRFFLFPTIMMILAWSGCLALKGPVYLASVVVLTTLEVTLSFDNASIDAKLLAKMSPFWQRVFMTVGVIIGVGVVRMIFPILMVSLTTALGFGQVWHEAWHNQAMYQINMAIALPAIVALASPFLALTFLVWATNQTITHEKSPDGHKHEWPLAKVERGLKRLSGGSLWFAVSAVLGAIFTLYLFTLHWEYDASAYGTFRFVLAGWHNLLGDTWLKFALTSVIAFLVVHALNVRVEKTLDKDGKVRKVSLWAGFVQLGQLELVDASFSLDSVSGAFAITGDFTAILIGLGVGALFVRAFTRVAVEKGTLGKYKYLENGAHWSMAALAILLPVSLIGGYPHMLTGVISISLITTAVVASKVRQNRINRRDAHRNAKAIAVAVAFATT